MGAKADTLKGAGNEAIGKAKQGVGDAKETAKDAANKAAAAANKNSDRRGLISKPAMTGPFGRSFSFEPRLLHRRLAMTSGLTTLVGAPAA